MDFQDLRRLVEERSTGYYQEQKKTDTYPKYHENREQHKIFKAMLRAEIAERFNGLNGTKADKIIVTTQHHIHTVNKNNRDAYYYYGSNYDKVKVPKGVDNEDFKIMVEARMNDGQRSWNCTRHNLTIAFVRHAKNMNWQTNIIDCNTYSYGKSNYNREHKTSEPMIYIARELEGLFGVEVSQVEKKYKLFNEKFKGETSK